MHAKSKNACINARFHSHVITCLLPDASPKGLVCDARARSSHAAAMNHKPQRDDAAGGDQREQTMTQAGAMKAGRGPALRSKTQAGAMMAGRDPALRSETQASTMTAESDFALCSATDEMVATDASDGDRRAEVATDAMDEAAHAARMLASCAAAAGAQMMLIFDVRAASRACGRGAGAPCRGCRLCW